MSEDDLDKKIERFIPKKIKYTLDKKNKAKSYRVEDLEVIDPNLFKNFIINHLANLDQLLSSKNMSSFQGIFKNKTYLKFHSSKTTNLV